LWPAKFSPKHDSDFISHLEELRKRLILALIVFFVATITCYFFSHEILDFLIRPLQRFGQVQLFFQKPYEAFLTHLKVSALLGFIFSTPVLSAQLWLFVTPGLYASEKKMILPLALITFALFLVGAAFAYLVVIPWGLHFLLSYQTTGRRPGPCRRQMRSKVRCPKAVSWLPFDNSKENAVPRG